MLAYHTPACSTAMTKGQIKHILAKTERQQRLSQPIDLASSSLACLPCNVRLYFRGYSELRQVASWLTEALECDGTALSATEACHVKLTPPGEAWPSQDQYRELSACREELYSRQPHVAHCRARNATLHYEWKSRMWSEYDATFHRRVLEAATTSGEPILAVLNGGPHHFNHLPDHTHALHHMVSDSFAFPQHWFDDYVDGLSRLFAAFSPQKLPANVCVLWRTSNVGPRLDGAGPKRLADHPGESSHHPSARNGLHDWLNRWSSAMARTAGIGVVDTSDLTSVIPPKNPEGGGYDFYHGFNSSLLLEPLVARACAACPSSWMATGGGRARCF